MSDPQVATLTSQLAAANTTIAADKATIADLQQKLTNAENRETAADTARRDAEAARDAANTKVADLTKERDTLRQDRDRLAAEVAAVTKERDAAIANDRSGEVASLTQQLADERSARRDAEDGLRDLRAHPPRRGWVGTVLLVIILLVILLVAIGAAIRLNPQWWPTLFGISNPPAIVAEEPILDTPPPPRTDVTVSGLVLAPPANDVERAFREDCAAHSGTLYTAEEWNRAGKTPTLFPGQLRCDY